jgi:hypothetical protein
MDADLFFVVSSPEVMAEADAVIENLLKVWVQACSLLYRVQRSWPRLRLSLIPTKGKVRIHSCKGMGYTGVFFFASSPERSRQFKI